ncbi:MAG: phosphate acyltransferase PlsX [Gammaproteobacteria bacterium]
MSKRIRIALDAMGGDHGVSVVVPAAVAYAASDPEVEIILVGDETAINGEFRGPHERVSVHHASQVVGMDELPSQALRHKKDSSMRVAINLVKEGEADACVSAGNTGALMATARFVLKMLPHIDRPAIITALPNTESQTWVLDLGANVDSSEEHLFQFAVMGAEQVSALSGIERPRVGLLNIGEEEIKGNEQVKKANELLHRSDLNYIGYVEGDNIFDGSVDVVVADGFVGNISLKSSEGVARMIRHFLKESFGKNLLTKLAGLIALPVLKSFARKIDPRRYNGASLLGLNGVVIKSHGGADQLAFANAIGIAKKAVHNNISHRIAKRVEAQLQAREQA